MTDDHLLITRNPPPPPEDVGGLAQKGLGPVTYWDVAICAIFVIVLGVIVAVKWGS